MPPKSSASSKASGSEPKRQRKMLTIKEKVELLDMLEEGQIYAAVGRHYGINESSVRCIKEDENNIRSAAKLTLNMTAKILVVNSHNKAIVRMRSALALWIKDCRKKNISLNCNTIGTKAKKLYDNFMESSRVFHDGDLDKDENDHAGGRSSSASSTKPTSFSARKDWYDKFQKRYGLQIVSLHGDTFFVDKIEALKFNRTSATKEDDKSQEHFSEESPVEPSYTPESSQGSGNVTTDSLNETASSSKRSRLSCPRWEITQRNQLTTEADSDDRLRPIRSNIENPYPSDRFDHLAKNWAEKLRSLNPTQRIYVEKLVNDVFYEGELCSLSRNSRVVVGESQPSHPVTQQFTSSFTPVTFSTRYQLPNNTEQQMQDPIGDDSSFIIVKDEILSADD